MLKDAKPGRVEPRIKAAVLNKHLRQPNILGQKRILTGISSLGVRSPSCEVVLSDPSAEEVRAQDQNNVTHNVTDDEDLVEQSPTNYDADITDVSRQVNKPVVTSYD